jgi:hypothetical protein
MPGNGASADSECQAVDNATLRRGLQTIRRRRWCLWIIILAYMPLMAIAMKTFNGVMAGFLSWLVIMFAIAFYTALARCPRCGNYFHMKDMTLLYLRKCLHCQLHVSADKRL